MNIVETARNGATVISLEGILNAAAAPQLKAHLENSDPASPTVIDLTNVEFIDSSGLGALVGFLRKKKTGSGSLKLANLNNRVKRVFEITQAYSLFDVYDDLEAAIGK
ncbi:STAS domain-containing protein [Chlorobium sp. N1]|uniref:STAS domain-containing protein n=1 Tax=Chlorobium sp. N1 TaxID=2491138 RepID=UPI00103A8996|nr:STAS domain-containing protein [Chlorobium sp. N1]TCD48544.1 anti-sigma factor antagonist [Chlorobium sp. N1]